MGLFPILEHFAVLVLNIKKTRYTKAINVIKMPISCANKPLLTVIYPSEASRTKQEPRSSRVRKGPGPVHLMRRKRPMPRITNF